MKLISALEEILASESRLMDVVKGELIAVGERYGDDRRTRIVEARSELTMHDLVAEEDQVVTVTQRGYIKRCSPDEWRTQRRGGTGKQGMSTRDEDFVTTLFIANTHSTLLVFTDTGKVYPLPVYELPEAGRGARGRPIVNLVPVSADERIAAVATIREDEPAEVDLLFVSRDGIVKRTPLAAFRNLRAGGMIATGVGDGDALMVVRKVEGDSHHLLLFTQDGKCIRCAISEVPELGRSARGNHGIKLESGDLIVDAVVISAEMPVPAEGDDEDDGEIDITEELPTLDNMALAGDPIETGLPTLLTITDQGFGKRTGFEEYRLQRRYGKGILSFRVNNKTGRVVGALVTSPEQLVMLVTNTGRVIRILAGGVRRVGRVTQGVRLMRLEAGERLVDLALLEEPEAALADGSEEGTSE